MRERREDTGIAVGLSVGIHVAVVLLGWVSWRFGSPAETLSVAGPPIEVEFVSAAPRIDRPIPAQAAPPPAALQPQEEAAPPPQPEPEPAPQDAMVSPQLAPQTPQAVPDTREQERASLDAVSPEPPVEREQDERRREEQVDLTEREEQQRTEERQRRSAQQLDRLRALAAAQRARAEASDQTRMEQQRLEQIADMSPRQPPSPDPSAAASSAQATAMAGNNGTDTSLEGAYGLAIQNAIERNWRRPETVPLGVRCRIAIVQIPGGDVLSVDVAPSCPYDAAGRDSLERAVMAAAPLPYAGFESVFRRQLDLNFIAQD